jgi:hypothetical protein
MIFLKILKIKDSFKSKNAMEKQLDILEAFTILRKEGKIDISYKDVASRVKIKSKTNVSACLKFWYSIGLLEKKDKGYSPSDITIKFFERRTWGDEEEAWSLMRSHLAKTWFGERVIFEFKSKSSMNEEELISVLGLASRTVKRDEETVKSLKAIIRLLELSKMIVKDESENFRLNQELMEDVKVKEIELHENKNVIKIVIGGEPFIVEIELLKKFVMEHGKKLAKEEIDLD